MAVSAVKKEAVKPGAATDAPQPTKPAFKWRLPLVALCVISAAGGGAYWYSTQNHEDAGKVVQAEPAKPPKFLPLDPFTVNLQLEDTPQFLQVGLTLKVADTAAIDALKLYMPEVRDRILRLLSSQKASTLLTLEGKRKLATDIVASINAIVAPPPAQPDAAPKAPAPAQTTPAAETEAKAAADPDAKPPADGDAKPTAEAGDAPAAEAAPAPLAAPAAPAATAAPVLSVLFTSFIVQ